MSIEEQYEAAKRYLRDQLGYVSPELLDGLRYRELLAVSDAARELMRDRESLHRDAFDVELSDTLAALDAKQART